MLNGLADDISVIPDVDAILAIRRGGSEYCASCRNEKEFLVARPVALFLCSDCFFLGGSENDEGSVWRAIDLREVLRGRLDEDGSPSRETEEGRYPSTTGKESAAYSLPNMSKFSWCTSSNGSKLC